MPKKKDPFKDVVEKLWPKTKKELDKALDNAKVLLGKGEVYLKDVSEKSITQTKKFSQSLLKEKLYYDLGKTISSTPKNNWRKNKKITHILAEIKCLDKKIKEDKTKKRTSKKKT